MKLLFAILLCVIPVIVDLFFGRIYWRKKTIVQHMFTATIRIIIIVGLSLLNSIELWRSALLAVSFHYLVFPILYNRLILGQRFDYLGTTADFDKAERWVRDIISTPGVFFFKILFLIIAVKLYISLCFQWWC